MIIESYLQRYVDFFNKEIEIDTKLTPEDKPIQMHNLEAIGVLKEEDRLEEIEEIRAKTPEELMDDAKLFYQDAFIRKAFFYYTMAHMKRGKSLDEILLNEDADFPITNVVGEYQVHKIHLQNTCNDPTVIFLDWDRTLDIDGALRHNALEFMKYFNDKRTPDGKKKYSLIITSATCNLMLKVNKYQEILPMVDAIYTVPVTQIPYKNNKKIVGKLYTDICDRLNIKNYRSVILTDSWGDRAVEAGSPIVTLVTPPNISADYWIMAIEFLEQIGGGDFGKAEYIVNSKNPKKILGMTNNPNEKNWRIYQTRDPISQARTNLYLARYVSRSLRHCFFMCTGDLPKTPPTSAPNENSTYL
jgi:hypothetical protein